MISGEGFNKLLRLASSFLSEARIRKVDIGPDEVFHCGIVSLTKAIVALTDRAFSKYLKKALSLGYSDSDARHAFFVVAKIKIERRINEVLDRVRGLEEDDEA